MNNRYIFMNLLNNYSIVTCSRAKHAIQLRVVSVTAKLISLTEI